MLVLSRKSNEKIVIGDNITITVVAIRGNRVRIGIEAPPSVSIHREELESLDAEFPFAEREAAADARFVGAS